MIGAGKSWFTANDLAELALPGLPKAKRKVNERALAESWAVKVDAAGLPLARRRAGRGGGLEYHLSLLPAAARAELVKRGLAGAAVTTEAPVAASQLWSWFDAQSETIKAKAKERAAIVAEIEALERANQTRTCAVAIAAGKHGLSCSTLWGWLALIDGVDPADRLPHLAPRLTGGGAEAEVDEGAWKFLISDYLRPEKPTWSSCYRRMVDGYATPRGLQVPHSKTLWRKLEREIDPRLVVAKRDGADALRRTLPPQQRTVEGMHALELVNIDGHKLDVFTRFPAANGQPERIGRPILLAIQDVYSRKILAWRIGETESAVLTRLAFADLFTNFGIPKGCLLDNGRAFASKWITGGAKSRFRFKIREEEPTGLLTALGIQIHWAKPYRGSSKPIERAFKDLCDNVAKLPHFAGAYTGNKPDAKPENYGERAIDLAVLTPIVAKGIALHNSMPNRRIDAWSAITRGRSFDQVFAESYAAAPIGKATVEQLRLALLTADEVSTCRSSGAVTLWQNRYWSPEMSQLAGRKVTARFDPDDLTKPIHVYDRAGRFIATVPVLEQTGFLDVAAAKRRAKQEGDLRKAMRAAADLEQLLSASQLATQLTGFPDEPDMPAPTVIRPVRHRGMTAAALRPAEEGDQSPPAPAFIDRFSDAIGRLRVVE